MSRSCEEFGSIPPLPDGQDGSCAQGSLSARETAEMTPSPDERSSFVYCDVCRDRTDEERQLAAVMEIANVINSQLDLDQILSTISKELSKVVDYDIGCVAIYDKEQNGLFLRHVWRKSGDKSGEGRYVPLDESNLVGWVAIHKRPVVRGDIPADTRFREIMKEDALKSDIVVPLMAKNALIGTVNIGSYTLNRFTDFDLDLIVRFSNLTSIAIEKCQLLRELEDLGSKYQLFMRNASEIIAIINASGEIVECNRMMCDLSGYTHEEIIGRDILSLMPPARREEARKRLSNILRGELTRLPELPYLKKTGELLYLEISATVIRIKDHPYILALAHDVTERKALQEKITVQNVELLTINKKLRELDDLKNEFLGRISHELRTPLSVIMAYTGTLIEDREQTIDPETRNEFLRVIDAHSNKLLGLINDLLDLSRVEVSETMLHIGEASLNDVIKISAKIAEPPAIQNGVRLLTELDESIPIMSFDPLRIRQACVNLLNNAVKFSREGDSVVIASRNAADEVVVSVRDHGPGIDANDIPALFEKFSQLDGGPTREKDGLGIGLKLVKHYVELHGGKVWVTSEMGAGSTFYFSLPKR
ncbi:MAG TPA: ATP-binding protein [Candidatus Krumholzibacteriaceae bacterium]